MQFSIKDFLIKYDQIRSFLRIWSHLLKKSLIENFIFSVVWATYLTMYWLVYTISLHLNDLISA